MRQQNRRIRIKAFFYLLIFAAVGFALNSLFITKKADGKSNLLAASLSATKTAALDTPGGDVNNNGVVNPGDRIKYTVTIADSGTGATGVNFSDQIDANTTYYAASGIIASPIAVNDGTYTSIGNVGISVPDGVNDLLANDLDPNNPASTAALGITFVNATPFVSGSAVATTNGSVTVNANGSFSYLPNPGFEGTDSFTYTLWNGTGLTDTATVQITVSEVIWFVNANAASNGDGRLNTPFNSLPNFNAGAADEADDVIFLYESGNAYTGGITLLTGQKLIGQDSTATLAASAGITVPPFINGLPAMNSGNAAITNLTGTTTINTNTILRGFSVNSTTNTGINDPAAAITGVNTSEINVTTTSGTAVLLSNAGGTFSLTSVNVNGANKGISLNNTTGSFGITGSGTTAGSGGTIQNITARGAEFITATNITLKNMNFTNNATVNGDTESTCANVGGGTNLNCNAAIHIVGVTGFSLDNVDVNGSSQVGVNGNNVTNFSMTNGSKIRNCGNESNENGMQFANLLGTSTITGATFSGNYNSGLNVVNTVATAGTLNVTSTAFTGNGVGTHGSALMKYSGDQAANMTVNIQSSSFNGSNSYGYFTDTATTARVTSTINNATFGTASANTLGFAYGNSASSKIDFNVTNNTIVGGDALQGAIYMVAFTETGTTTSAAYINGTFDNNHIGTAGVVGSGCKNNCGGVGIFPAGAGAMNLTITNNDIRQVSSQGINLSSNASTTGTLILHIKHNTLAEPQTGFNNFLRAIALTPGNSAGASPTSCFEIGGSTAADKNIISGSWQAGSFIRVANQNNTGTTRFPGYGGSATDQAALNAFVEANNTVTPSGNTNITPGNGISGGAACTPTPLASLIQEGIINTSGDFANNLSFLNPSYQSAFASLTDAQAASCGQSAETERILTNDTAVSRQALSDMSASDQSLFNQSGTTRLIKHGEIIKTANAFETSDASAPTHFASLTTTVGYYLGELDSIITPTVSAQVSEIANTLQLAPKSGETITKSLGTIPNGEQIVVQFKATINTTPANFFSVSNQGTISATGLSNVLTDDPAVAGANNPTVTSVIQPPSISKTFGASFVPVNGTMTLTYTITNPNSGTTLTGLAFSDILPAGLVINTPNGLSNTCGGTVTATANTNLISLSGGTVGVNTSCTVKIDVKGTTEGAKTSATNNVNSTNGGAGNSASGSITVINSPTLTKTFTPNRIPINATSTLQFTVGNSNATSVLNNLAFTDSLPSGVTAADVGATTVCGDASYSIAANVISFTKPTLAAGANCIFSVVVTGTSAGDKNNLTSAITAMNSGVGAAASATLTVVLPPIITAASVTRTQAASANSQIATVNDNEDTENTLAVKVNGNSSATVNGVTVSGINIDAAGNVTANVGASCTATNASFTLRVTDSDALFAEVALNVTVNPATLVWNGATNSDWNTAANWTPNCVPTGNSAVALPSSGVTNEPAITVAAAVNNLTVGANRSINISGANGSLSVNGVLTMNGNNINGAGANNLLIVGAAGGITRTSGAVIGSVRKFFAAGASAFTFPMGTANGYSPVQLSNISGAGDFTVSATQDAYLNPATGLPANRLGRWWTLTNNGLTQADVQFNYLATDIPAGMEANYKAFKIESGAASQQPTTINATNHTATVLNVANFSDWTLAEVLAPTAATVQISGRVTTASGRGIARARVKMIDAGGNVFTAQTNPFGYYRFADVPAGSTYIISASAKRYEFAASPQAVWLTEERNDINFVALP